MRARPRPGRLAIGGLGCAALLAAALVARAGSDAADAAPPEAPVEDVVLLHGLARSAWAMRPLASTLEQAGYRVHNLEYPSTESTPAELVAHLHGELQRCCADATRLHFVTHSLGGILVRAYLAEHELPTLGRVVMLAPPNHGSEYVDALGDWKLFPMILGPTAIELGTGAQSLPNRLPVPDFELGVIAGTGGLNWLGDAVIDGPNDGTVGVDSARIEGMRDFLALDVSHTFIMREPAVAEQTIAFLRNGHFER